jgi:hypothetical protein
MQIKTQKKPFPYITHRNDRTNLSTIHCSSSTMIEDGAKVGILFESPKEIKKKIQKTLIFKPISLFLG